MIPSVVFDIETTDLKGLMAGSFAALSSMVRRGK